MQRTDSSWHLRLQSIDEIVHEIIALYLTKGREDYIGEPVSQIEHMSQCAQLALSQGADTELVLAAFFHDIGHLCAEDLSAKMGEYGIQSHEEIGASYLRMRGFSDRVTTPIINHVNAKRYLTLVDHDYFVKLSYASKYTLGLQGGPMNEAEAEEFMRRPYFA